MSIIQTIAEAEINLALKDDFEPAEELGLYAEAVVFSNIIKATALTTRAKTILNLIMGDESLWSELETLSASGRYDEVRQIISSIVKSARSYDRFLGRESILAGINFYKEWDRSALAA